MARTDPSQYRTRREPPTFLSATVGEVQPPAGSLVRIGLELAGEGVGTFEIASSIRVLLPRSGTGELEMPRWNGNEFLYDDGSRPPIRTLTPIPPDGDHSGKRLDIIVVLHGVGPLSEWASSVRPGDVVAVSGPGRGFSLDGLQRLILAGDECALPAISVVLDAIDRMADPIPTSVVVEIRDPSEPPPLVTAATASLRRVGGDPSAPGAALLEAVRTFDVPTGTHVWAAGEAAAMQQVRRYLFDELGLTRSETTVRGYWKRVSRPGR